MCQGISSYIQGMQGGPPTHLLISTVSCLSCQAWFSHQHCVQRGILRWKRTSQMQTFPTAENTHGRMTASGDWSACSKSFSQKHRPAQHQNPHTRENTRAQRGKCFKQSCDLPPHQRIHTGAKPYDCSEGEECFSCKTALVWLQREHTGEGACKGIDSGKSCSQNAGLISHPTVYAGKKPFQCALATDPPSFCVRIHTGGRFTWAI